MKNKPALILLITILLVSVFLLFNNANKPTEPTSKAVIADTNTVRSSVPQSVTPADKIEVVHFHGTQQCVSCVAVGKLAKQTIEDKFPEEVKSGKIVFKEINAELPENQALVMKYQARGSSLFVNAIRGEKDDIAEDTKVWQLVNSESQYVAYFGGKLSALLGK